MSELAKCESEIDQSINGQVRYEIVEADGRWTILDGKHRLSWVQSGDLLPDRIKMDRMRNGENSHQKYPIS